MAGHRYLLVEKALANLLARIGVERIRQQSATIWNRATGEERETHVRLFVGQLFSWDQLHDLPLDGPRLLSLDDAYYFVSPDLKDRIEQQGFSYLQFLKDCQRSLRRFRKPSSRTLQRRHGKTTLPVIRLNHALKLDRQRHSTSIAGFSCGHFYPAFADAVFLDVGAFIAVEADADVVLEDVGVVMLAARVGAEVIGQRGFGGAGRGIGKSCGVSHGL